MLAHIWGPIQGIRMPSEDDGVSSGVHPREHGGTAKHRSTISDGGKVAIDDVLGILANANRRAVFYYLREHEVASVEELAHHIAAQCEASTSEESRDSEVEHVTLDLVHNTLPKLADSQFIEYDSRSQTVRYSQPPALLEAVLRFLARFE